MTTQKKQKKAKGSQKRQPMARDPITKPKQVVTGGGFFDMFKPKPAPKPAGYFSQAVASENELIDSYESLAASSKRYYDAYNSHIKNLITLDDIYAMNGLISTFRNTVLVDSFKHEDVVDRANPLFLRNYLAGDETTPRNFRKEHMLSQVRYCIRKFNPKDEILIQDVDLTMEDGKALVTIYTINGDTHERSVTVNEDFNLDLTKLKSDIREIIKSVKRKMDFEIEVISDFDFPSDGGLEVPGLLFADSGTALDKKLKEMEMRKSVKAGANDPVPLSQQRKEAEKVPAAPKDVIFDYSSKKRPVMPEPVKEKTAAQEGEPVYADIGLDQGFGGRMLEKKPIMDELMGLFATGPGGMMTADELAGIGGAQQAMQTPQVPGMAATGTGGGFNGLPQVKQFGNTAHTMPPTAPAAAEPGDLMEQKCKVITDPTVCKQTLGCFYNFPKKVCHKDVKV
jgi:hypothetical protein